MGVKKQEDLFLISSVDKTGIDQLSAKICALKSDFSAKRKNQLKKFLQDEILFRLESELFLDMEQYQKELDLRPDDFFEIIDEFIEAKIKPTHSKSATSK